MRRLSSYNKFVKSTFKSKKNMTLRKVAKLWAKKCARSGKKSTRSVKRRKSVKRVRRASSRKQKKSVKRHHSAKKHRSSHKRRRSHRKQKGGFFGGLF